MEQGTTYTPPMILTDVDDDIIHARMLEALPNDIDKTEGGFAHDFTRPAALEKAEMMIAVNDAVQVFFPAWSYGGYLDKLAGSVGLSRKAAQPAETYLEITGTEGTIIPAGFIFATPKSGDIASIEFAVVESATISAEGRATVLVRCTETGLIGNVPENSITLMSSPMKGVTTIRNPAAATGGIETEDDESLRARIEEREKNNEASFVGNDSDYKRWAKEVDGVGSVVVVPEWMGKGSGTVKLIVMDANGMPANDTILKAVYDHIISPDNRDYRLAPIGAILTVTTAEAVGLTFSATILLEEDAVIDDVVKAYRTNLLAYFEEAKAESCIRYTRVCSVLSETKGVLDYSNMLLNGATANIAITADDYPTIATVALTEAS